MFCSKCGKQIPDDANYCCYCGHPLKGAAQDNTRIQVCSIREKNKCKSYILSWYEYWIEAEWDGKIYYESEKVNSSLGLSDYRRKLEVILVNDGWEPVAQDQWGFITTLRRKVPKE